MNQEVEVQKVSGWTILTHVRDIIISGVILTILLTQKIWDVDEGPPLLNTMFKVNTGLGVYSILLKVLYIYRDSLIFGETLQKKIIEYNRLCNSKCISMLVMITNLVSPILSMMYVPYFIPYSSDNCNGYGNVLCGMGRFYAFFGIIFMIIYGIIIIIMFYFWIILCRHIYMMRQREQMTMRQALRENAILTRVLELTPLKHLDLFTVECKICMCDGKESEDSKFIELKCGHMFHNACLDKMIKATSCANVCPVCRQPIVGDNIKNLHKAPTDISVIPNTTATGIQLAIAPPSTV